MFRTDLIQIFKIELSLSEPPSCQHSCPVGHVHYASECIVIHSY